MPPVKSLDQLINIYRQFDGGWCWRATVIHQKRRYDRLFYDTTYGSEELAQSTAVSWQRTALSELNGIKNHHENQARVIIDGINREFDLKVPKRLYISLYRARINGEDVQLRGVVSLHAGKNTRKEFSVNFRRITIENALDLAWERCTVLIEEIAGKKAKAQFQREHPEGFKSSWLTNAKAFKSTIYL